MRVVERVVTSAPPEVVWRVLTDVERWCDWTPTVIAITPLGDAAIDCGARYRVEQPKLRPAIYEVTGYVPGERFTWKQKLPGGGLVADHLIVRRNDATEVELSFSSQGLLANIVATILSKRISQYVATEATSLKTYCDALSYQRAG